MMNIILINIDELWLRGKNRKLYFDKIQKQIRKRVKIVHHAPFSIKNENQRLILKSEHSFNSDIEEALKYLPGINSLVPVIEVHSEIENIKEKVIELLKEEYSLTDEHSFKVECQRIDKRYPINSVEVARLIGGEVLKSFERFFVKMKSPDIIVNIKITQRGHSYISTRKIKGIGGLPVGTSGRGLTLLSGGFDSPVASIMMATRGIGQDFVFFHAYPFVGEEVLDKIKALANHLAQFQAHSFLHIITFGNIQKIIAENCEESYRTNLFRWAMVKTAERLSHKVKSKALITGDSLGQVASQTLETLSLLDKSIEIPILRPLVGMQKKEIIRRAEQYGTYDISKSPHDDACSMLAPKHPVIYPNIEIWKKSVTELDKLITSEIDLCIENITTLKL